MASVSVVGPGQHRPAPDHQLVFHKLKAAGRNKITLPWKSSVEIILGESSVTRECGSVSAVSAVKGSPLNPSLTPGQQGAAAGVRGGDPGVRCEAQPGLVTRNSDRESDSSSPACGDTEGDTTAAREDTGQSGRSGSGNDSTRDRRSSLKILTNVMSSTSANTQMTDVKCDRSSAPTNGHMGAHSHRDRPVRRRASHSPHGQTTGLVTKGDTGGPPLERLTQGRTGVVKLARTESHRREVWSIFVSQEQEDARVRSETGEGHKFGTRTVTQDWCDVCNQRISAQQALKCKNCNYTCHQECGGRVQLDCNQRDSNPQETTSPRRHCSTPPQYKKEVEEDRGPKALSEEELRARIEDYNSMVSENGMKLGADGLYTGFIKVHLRLSRPVTMLTMEWTGLDGQAERQGRPMTVSEGQEGAGAGFSEKRTSFYLPSDCVKQIHISSTTTVREVIQGLLKKFMVQDNPRKFALYRQTHRDGQDLFQKLPLVECPLALRLVVGPDPELLSFVLKENETGEVDWHAFSVPELQNFLVILEKEEAERVRLVEQRFAVYRQSLQKALQEDQP
ncbi:ras association domain-containing protein 5 isoform X2 [Salmo salar]|uniref:Ras association domain-containing protein 5 isoform X2 n=1 Tax=Salmo salar TaxID=8030 RepID=A0A1S3P2P0_SALSA|nr:ras association domain-containing protein 5-like isoform X2 [Salmo salar]|eukprot:XP_014021800.1 PREDICTED: ras association domain-containing protein 5-like isoform X2 [Salmo salar]